MIRKISLFLFILMSAVFIGAWSLNFISLDSNVTAFKIKRSGFEVSLDYHKVQGQKNNQTIIIIPPTGGRNILDQKYARSFSQKGFNTYIIKTWSDQHEVAFDKELHNRFYGRGLKAVRYTVEHILSNNQNTSIGLLGSSVGALHGLVSTHSLPQIKKFFAISGGIDFSQIITKSDQFAMRLLKQKRFKLYPELNTRNYYSKFKEYIKLEPSLINFDRNSKCLGQSLIENDSTVPTTTQILLKEFWKPEKLIVIKANLLSKIINYPHKAGIILTSIFHEKDIIEFFTSQCSQK